MGVSGSGKTTIGKLLAHKTGIPFFDADDFHPAANKEKMKAGIPLTDADRKDWLQQLHTLAVTQEEQMGAIIACSALKEKYRAVLNEGLRQPQWIFLKGDYETIYSRLQQRKGHFMPPALLQSQFKDLEPPSGAIIININQPPEMIVADILAQIHSS
ncbi:MAG: gluconokinase [Bacteroidetes bacterium]|nr:gluconokinase [Bacteroidota bacterium]